MSDLVSSPVATTPGQCLLEASESLLVPPNATYVVGTSSQTYSLSPYPFTCSGCSASRDYKIMEIDSSIYASKNMSASFSMNSLNFQTTNPDLGSITIIQQGSSVPSNLNPSTCAFFIRVLKLIILQPKITPPPTLSFKYNIGQGPVQYHIDQFKITEKSLENMTDYQIVVTFQNGNITNFISSAFSSSSMNFSITTTDPLNEGYYNFSLIARFQNYLTTTYSVY